MNIPICKMGSIILDAKYFQTKVGMQMGAKAFIVGMPINSFKIESRASSARTKSLGLVSQCQIYSFPEEFFKSLFYSGD